MGNTLQSNPSDATDDFNQPDWNSAAGEGVAPAGDDAMDPNEVYEAQREGARERAGDKDADERDEEQG